MMEVAWTAMLDALVEVEGLAPDDSGLLTFGAGTAGSGGVFVERSRICWAAAHGLRHRLRDLLQTFAGVDDDALEAVYQRCRAEGRLLGQTLVDEGWIEPRELEIALRRHSAESLVELCRSHQPTRWSPHGGLGYAPLFTFRPVDVLLDVVALYVPHAQRVARLELTSTDGSGLHGAAFLVEPGLDTAIPLAELGYGMTVRGLRTLGRWARSVQLASRELGAAPSFTLATTASGGAISVWWRDELLYAVCCEDRASVAAITAYHLAGA